MRYTLKQLRYTLAAAHDCSVTRASEKMNVSQPSISAAIAHLEDSFGVQIFIRHHAQGLSLTPAGRRFMQEANRLLVQAEGLELYAKELGDTVMGNLDVGCISTVAAVAMPALMRTFNVRYPEVGISCFDQNQEELLKGLHEGRFELALTYDMQLGKEFVFKSLVELPPYALLPLDHPLAENDSVSLLELAGHPMVMLDLPLSREYFRSLFLSVGVEPEVVYKARSLEMARSLVGNGYGYTLSNVHLHHTLSLVENQNSSLLAVDGTRYRARPLRDSLLPLRFGLVQLKDSRLTRLTERFAEYCIDYFRVK